MLVSASNRILICSLLGTACFGQNTLTTPPEAFFSDNKAEQLPSHIWRDQKRIWTSPFHLKKDDLKWMIPLGATTGLLIATDQVSAKRIHSNLKIQTQSSNVSNVSLAVVAGSTAFSYGLGAVTHNLHARETGVLGAEALADSFLVTEALKFVSQRDRPGVNDSQGSFWNHLSSNSSFPSQHTALAWSAATVIAREYPGPLTQWTAYGLASVTGISRAIAERHFPSDVLVGAATGYLIGRYVYHAHHDAEDTVTRLRTKHEPLLFLVAGPTEPQQPPLASVYVPLDSWIYPALRRLADLGLIPDQASNLAPWTRGECLRQVQQASRRLETALADSHGGPLPAIAIRLVSDLKAELDPGASIDNVIRLESLYTRVSAIGGSPLRDSYHFGQTIANDFGRPYEEGFNNISGFSSYAVAGRLSAYVRGEYQSAPGRASAGPDVRTFIANADGVPPVKDGSFASTNRFQTLEMYVGAQLGFENITFGKQNLWWGPGEQSAFSFSNNAEPFYSLRFAQTRPLILPGPFRYLGKIRTDIVFGKLSGHQFPARPYMAAQKISLDLTDDFEIGFTRSSFFGGVGHPLTFGALKETLFGVESVDNSPYGSRSDLPGDRHSGFDFRWRVPGVRHYLTIYSDSYADDEPNPIDNPRRSAWAPGLYVSHLPGLARMDFRFETYSTLLYAKDFGGQFLYINNQYRDSYTNNGYLLGSWIGRDSRAYSAQTSYWSTGRSKITAGYRQIKAGTAYLPGGGTQTDVSLAGTWGLSSEWLVSGRLQGERYDIPVLGPARRDFLTSVGVTYTPHEWTWH